MVWWACGGHVVEQSKDLVRRSFDICCVGLSSSRLRLPDILHLLYELFVYAHLLLAGWLSTAREEVTVVRTHTQ